MLDWWLLRSAGKRVSVTGEGFLSSQGRTAASLHPRLSPKTPLVQLSSSGVIFPDAHIREKHHLFFTQIARGNRALLQQLHLAGLTASPPRRYLT